MNIKVGDTILDQFQNTIIAQNYETNNFGDISTRNGGFSNDFTIPLTSKNEVALGFPSDLNIDNRNPYQKVDAQLIDVGAVISIGYLRYKIVNDKTLQCAFFTDNTEWFNLIKDKNLVDLDLSDMDHIWNDVNIVNAIVDNHATLDYTYPLIDYGFFKNESLSSPQTTVPVESMYPGIYASRILTQIFTDIGWNVEGELLTDERFEQCIQPFSAEEFAHSQSFITSSSLELEEDSTGNLNQDTVSDASILISWDNASTVINVTETGLYNITASVDVSYTCTPGNSTQCQATLRNNTSTIDNQITVLSNGENFTYNLFAANVELDSSDDIDIEVTLNPGTENGVVTFEGGLINLDLLPEIIPGGTIQMGQTMPDISQSDFLKYIFFSFGVVPQPDNYSKTVSLDFFRTIEDNVPNALDWSEKLDVSQSIETDFTQLLNNYSRVSKVNYEEDDNDPELSAYLAETKRNFGDGKIDIDNEHLDPQKEIYVAPYTPMININSFSNELYIPQIKWFIEDADNPGEYIKDVEPSPKIGLITSDRISIETLSLGETEEILFEMSGVPASNGVNSINFTWFVKTKYINEVDAIDYSLAYDPTAFITEIGSTLLDTYVSDYEDILNEMKYVTASFVLDETDINGLDFLIPVYIDRFKAYFYINKIKNYQGATKSTQVELIKISNG